MLLIFFGKSSHFPMIFIIIYLVNLFFVGSDTIVANFLHQDSGVYNTPVDYSDMIRQIAACAVWIPYMICSTRVKETFVKK